MSLENEEKARARALSQQAREALGIDSLLLAIHDPSFPCDAGEDIGRGSPYSHGAERLAEFADGLGFNGVQLGPQGVTSPGNRSPYDGTVFSRSPLSIALAPLMEDPEWAGLFDTDRFGEAVAGAPPADGLVHHEYSERAHAAALDAAFARYTAGGHPALEKRLAEFVQNNAEWLAHDAQFQACVDAFGSDDPRLWPSSTPDAAALERSRARYALGQLVVHAQHHAFRDRNQSRGWKVFGDVQVGLSLRDRWLREPLFLDGYALGAPPSRTDPEGQPWGFAVLRPGSLGAEAFFRARVRKIAREYDGLRIDHPHGLVCPWVYDRARPDSLAAVRAGARLLESPDLPDHPSLAAFAIARPEQLDRSAARYDDGWVRELDEGQIDRYAQPIGVLLHELRAAGGSTVACEVLSTAPLPLVAVLRRHGLGRFRVTQKANLEDPRDGYRSDNAEPGDWIMVGTHDTRPLSRVVEEWFSSRSGLEARAEYLAGRLEPDLARRPPLVRRLAREPGAVVQAMTADLFASRARHVVIFMSDLFGLHETYNRPGTVTDDNWRLRVPNDFERAYRRNLAAGHAMGILGALAAALRARNGRGHAELAAGLDAAQLSLFDPRR